ncbi:MAG: hypothetical protein Q7K55_05765, partial [Candidatus Levybacteria bacterium]|nr:hypothetical protein [Candidatus Levybacteria bacterium]
MTKNKSKQNENIVSKDSLIGEVYFSLKSLSEKYGYAKDYLGQLSRSGRIEAIRHGKYGQWYASEGSLKEYQLSLSRTLVSKITSEVESGLVISGSKPDILLKVSPFPAETTPVSIGHELETANVPPVLSTVLFKNDGSYSADSGLVSRKNNLELAVVPERINAILTLSIVLGGILFFTNIHPLTNLDIIKTPLVSKFSENFKKNIQSAWNEDIQLAKETLTTVGNLIPIGAKNTTASIWTNFLAWLFPDTTSPTYVTIEEYNNIIKEYESRITNLENHSSGLTGPTGPRGPVGPAGQTIIRETIIQSGSAFNLNTILTDLASLNQEVDSINSNFNLQFATLN